MFNTHGFLMPVVLRSTGTDSVKLEGAMIILEADGPVERRSRPRRSLLQWLARLWWWASHYPLTEDAT